MNQHLIKAVDQLQFVHYEQNSMVCHTSKSEGPSAEPRSIVHLMVKKRSDKNIPPHIILTAIYNFYRRTELHHSILTLGTDFSDRQ